MHSIWIRLNKVVSYFKATTKTVVTVRKTFHVKKNVVANFFKLVFQSSWKKGRFSKDMRSTNSRTPNSRSWDFPLQGYKEPSLRMEGSLQCNQLLTIWYTPGFVGKLIKLWWPCGLFSLTLKRAVLLPWLLLPTTTQ